MHCGVYVGTRDSLLGKAALLMKEGDVVLAQFNDPACGYCLFESIMNKVRSLQEKFR